MPARTPPRPWLGLLLGALAGWSLLPAPASAGGGPANVLVLFNAEVLEAEGVARHYAEARSLPNGHLCGLGGIDPTTRTLDLADFETLVRAPLDGCLQALPQPEEIDYLVLVRGLPYRVDLGGGGFFASLSATLQVGHAQSAGTEVASLPQGQSGGNFAASLRNPHFTWGFTAHPGDYTLQNPYEAWYNAAGVVAREAVLPASFRRADAPAIDGIDYAGHLFLVTRLDGFDWQDATDLVDRAVAAEVAFPTAPLACMASADEPRGPRDPECEFVVRLLSAAGFDAEFIAPHDASLAGRQLAAYFTGTANLRDGIEGNELVPGAVACNLTSVGAAPTNFFCTADGSSCPQSESQTSIARFVRAGATGVHGTVAEPLNNVFPNAAALLFYTFGYNFAESFHFAQRYLHWQNLYLGDPLTTPWARRPTVTVTGGGEVTEGGSLQIEASHPDGIAGLVLYLDGVRVAEEASGALEQAVTAPAGATLEVLAVATSTNVRVARTGWPNEDHFPQPDLQGWTRLEVTVVEAVAPGADGGTDGGPGGGGDSPGCGCASESVGAGPAAGLLVLGLLASLLLRRRRA